MSIEFAANMHLVTFRNLKIIQNNFKFEQPFKNTKQENKQQTGINQGPTSRYPLITNYTG